MDIANPLISHAVRANYFENEATWRLGPDALERDETLADGRRISASFPYADIVEVRLSFAPTRFDTARYRCDLRFKRTVPPVVSTHYASVGDFENRAETYVPLVRGLVGRVAAANPACRFTSGNRPLVYWAEHIFLLAMLLLLVSVLGLVGGAAFSELVLIKLGIIAVFVPVMIRYTRKNWPRRFTATSIPKEALPDV